jgi:cell division septal protein FtsQ
LSGGNGNNPRKCILNSQGGTLSQETIEKIRGRSVRARFKSLEKWVWPLKVLIFVFTTVLLAYLAIFQLKQLFFGTSYFELKKIEVAGLIALNRDEVVKLAGVAPLMNILTIDLEAIRDRLLLHSTIRSARVTLDGLYTLRLEITERTPLMYVKAGLEFFEIAEDGVILACEELPRKDLPFITGIDTAEKRLGDTLATNDTFHDARFWIKNLEKEILRGISEVNFSSPENPFLFLISGVKVIPKSLPDFKSRYVFLCALLDNLKRNRVEPEYLDLRAPNEIVVKPRREKRPSEGGKGPVAGG